MCVLCSFVCGLIDERVKVRELVCVLVCELVSEHACVLMRVGAGVCSVCVKWVRRADQKGGEREGASRMVWVPASV